MINYQEAQEVCKILAALNFDGQRTHVMPETFLRPNFAIVCEILKWFAKILDPSIADREPILNIPSESMCSSEVPDASRVAFLVTLGKRFRTLLGVYLNLVSLYRADMTCCPELLKLARPIYKATKLAVEEKTNLNKDPNWFSKEFERKRQLLKETLDYVRQENNLKNLSIKVSQLASEVEVLLNNEDKFNEERLKVIDRGLELDKIANILRNSYEGIVDKTKELIMTNDELEKDLVGLDEKLAGKEAEISEAKSKLNELLVQSPTYASQYEKLRKDYDSVYYEYVSSYRNLVYLRSCIYSSGDDQLAAEARDDFVGDELLATGVDSGQLDELAASKPSAASGVAAGLLRAGDKGRRLLAGPEMVGPARLLESLFEAEGASKPMSASLTTETGELGAAGAVPDDRGTEGAAEPTGTGRGRTEPTEAGRLYSGRANEAGDAGLELEGLLSEFALDNSVGAGADEDPGAGGEAGDDDDEGEEDEDEEDSDGDEEEDEDELAGLPPGTGLTGKY